MKKVALLLIISILVPSGVLAWLAVRTLRDQEYLIQRQQSVVYQSLADNVARDIQAALDAAEHDFNGVVSALLASSEPRLVSARFDREIRQRWPLAQIGFVVNRAGALACPSPGAGAEASQFCANYGTFLTCRESAEVYWSNGKQGLVANADLLANNSQAGSSSLEQYPPKDSAPPGAGPNTFEFKNKGPIQRKVVPQQQGMSAGIQQQEQNQPAYSRFAASEAEFCQLTSASTEGMLARFVDNKLSVLFWCRPAQAPSYVFGAQLSLAQMAQLFSAVLTNSGPGVQQDVCLAVLDDNARPAALSRAGFHAIWKRPFVASEIGEALPHWEVAVYLLDPVKLQHSAQVLRCTIGLLVVLLVIAISVGSWLIIADLNRQLTLARQKTDFVSNVSHELKTPLTSIRMFSELLAEGRVSDPAKQRNYLGIITAEASRLTRLINNVLDFARIERNEKKYQFENCELSALVRETCDTFRPHLETNGFDFPCELPAHAVPVRCDRDAIAQVLVNLLSNAEKYAGDKKQVALQMSVGDGIEVRVLDRGTGIPAGCEEKIFEQFYRAHDSLSSGVQGTGLGLTLARQIARAHGGDVIYQPRESGGSCFILQLPKNLKLE